MVINDVNIDANYVAGSSKSCNELACCEAAKKSTGTSDKAGLYAENKCHLSITGFDLFMAGVAKK